MPTCAWKLWVGILCGMACLHLCGPQLRAEQDASESAEPVAAEEACQADCTDESACECADSDADTPTTYRLAYKFSPNQTVHYEVQHSSELEARQGSQSETVKSRTEEQKHFQVVALDPDGNATLELTIDRVQMSVQFDNHPEEDFDTSGPPDADGKFHSVRMSVGKPMARIRVAPTGELLSIDPLQVVDWNAPGPRQVEANQAKSDPKQTFLDQNVLLVLPENPVKIGDQWSERYDVRVTVDKHLTRSVKMRRLYELKSVSAKLATISIVTAVLTPVRDPAISVQLIQMKPAGDVVFDMESGAIVSRDMALEERVIGPWGPNSMVYSTSNRAEQLVEQANLAKAAD